MKQVFFVLYKFLGGGGWAGTLDVLTSKCPGFGQGGMLAAGCDSHIMCCVPDQKASMCFGHKRKGNILSITCLWTSLSPN